MKFPSKHKTHTLSIEGLRCPEPIMIIRKTIRIMKDGDFLLIKSDDPSTRRDIPNLCRFMDHKLLIIKTNKLPYRYLIKKGIK
ncbi:sulfurtransferase TusA [Candidatus Photodesmus anomalopis]|uniref:Sulfur carrier protein TusA n=1 Tax=Candidatus Photodesmus katoptron Akat1 TaxID=1236703 RepID=S3DIJ2_9GAMM|nr:sulfurtransferase TusA [Candidatus Photodesmus katoptron]EPE37540.1 sirA-like protein [Candidatus Photodesmus katoptron Akat1]